MKYPKLKYEEKKNAMFCSLHIKKIKGPSSESLEKIKKYHTVYNNRRYNNDPEFRRKMLDSSAKHRKDKMINDPKFKKWHDQMTKKNNLIWRKKQLEKHPTWTSLCCFGSHETTTRVSKCKNSKGNCKCPCHK